MPVITWFTAALAAIIAFLPNLLAAVLILLIGWGIAKLVQLAVVKGLRALHFDRMSDREGITDALKRAEIKATPAQVLGIVVYWFIFLIAIAMAVEALGIVALSTFVTAFLLYLPRIFAALLIIVVGAWVASLLGRLTRGSAEAANVPYASLLGNIVIGVVLFFTFTWALDTLGLNFPFLVPAFAILLGAVGLALALAFGFGGREYAADYLAGRQVKQYVHTGDRILAGEIDGTVTDIGPTVTVVQTSRGEVAVQNSELIQKHLMWMKKGGEGGGNTFRAA